MDNNISFTSLIKPVGFGTFHTITARMPKSSYVAYPWTLKEAAMATDVFTKSVSDCSVYVISDGQKAKMYHICPGCEDAKEFTKIESDIESNFDLASEDVEAFILGAKPPYKVGESSYELFEKFEKFTEKYNIPTTILKGGSGERSFAYSSTTDTLYIANTEPFNRSSDPLTSPLDILRNWFDKVVIHPKDNVIL